MADKTSPEYTVTLHAGAMDTITDCVRKLEEVAREAESDPKDYEDLARRREKVLEETFSFLRGLHSVLLSNDHDGNVHLFRDSDRSFFFRYDSGYHGGLIHHTSSHRWSIHT